jgi:hypothetical protein
VQFVDIDLVEYHARFTIAAEQRYDAAARADDRANGP